MNLVDIAREFSDEDKAREFLEQMRWPDGTVCPHCGEVGTAFRITLKEKTIAEIERLRQAGKRIRKTRKGLWKCAGCREQFTVTVGTIFEDSHIPLHKWLMAVHLLCASKKGMSAHQLHRMLGVTYKSAWFMAHRIRYAMSEEPLSSKLTGTIEVDETFIGGKRRIGPQSVKPGERPKDKLMHANKASVVTVLQRGGRVQSRHVERVTAENLRPMIDLMVAEDAHLMTDTSTVLRSVGKGLRHDKVNHGAGEYVRYEDGVCITTNTVEGYFANLKRGIDGVYHHVGRQHLHRYLSEFDFRYNARKITDSERTKLAIDGVKGKRLMYRDSCGNAGKQPVSDS
jgi:transposase-like protein